MGLPKWLAVLGQVGPIILSATPLAPIAMPVQAAIALAESMPGKTGPEKLALVQGLAQQAAAGVNAQAGHTVVDPSEVQSASAAVISAVVDTVNLVHDIPVAQLTPTTVGPTVPAA